MNGFLIIDKSSGMTSFDVIRRLKRIAKFKKIGYVGTLDKNATGILPVAINEGVKLIPYIEDMEKRYIARILLGVVTNTYDVQGKVLSRTEPPKFDQKFIEETLQKFRGRIRQRIPPFSSKKVGRKPLYKLARKGIQVEPMFKDVEIYDIKLTSYEHPYIDIELSCSKGTYVRSLANDLGEMLGCGATLYSLKRTRHGEFGEELAVKVEDIKTVEDIEKNLIPCEKALSASKEVIIEKPLERFLRHGMPIPIFGNAKDFKEGELTKILNKEGKMMAIGIADPSSKIIKVKRLMNVWEV
ncbi:MAG: tRNA pseudouridine(55) synthase TruB [Desulfobacterota bacterium]|nr:tRNA pseudouridine(55) synthase TruB [Thermodesulfobacteriota bacterium]MDW8001921.1 tRNA pseudouridine(55) synthase TruB [Deltaproteobacteria bacterium]